MRRLVTVVVVCGVIASGALGLSSLARADDAAESRFFDRLARRAFEARHFEDALESFLLAQRAAPSVRGLYNVAVCAQLAHEDALAFASFEQLLARPDLDAAMRTEAEHGREALGRTLALVRVVSDPPGAEIFVDRRDLGTFGVTPATLALAPGPHTLELARDGHEDARAQVEARVGELAPVQARLAPLRGEIEVDVSAPGATLVARRGDDAIPLSAGASSTLDVGLYSLEVSAPGFVPTSVEVRVTASGHEHRVVTLDPAPVPHGRLLATTGAVHARVRIDGEDRAETPARIDDLSVGPHQIAIRAEGWLDWSGEVQVEADRTAFVSVTLVRAP